MNDRLLWERDERSWPHREASRVVHAGGTRWHVRMMGQGPAALLIHGTGSSSHSWRRLAPLLAPHWTVVAPDLPGHAFTGSVPARRLSLPSMAAALSALVDVLGVEIGMCLGHSAGAAVAMRMTLDRTIDPRVLLAVNGAFFPLSGLAGLTFPLVARAMATIRVAPALFAWRASDRAAVGRLIAGTGSSLDDEGTALYAGLMRDTSHVAGALGMMAQWDLRPLTRDLRRLTTPLALLVGSNDRAVPPADARRVLTMLPPGTPSTLTVLDAAGHLAHEERPEAVAQWVLRSMDLASHA
jgi:magnesium chelatase accessory protein